MTVNDRRAHAWSCPRRLRHYDYLDRDLLFYRQGPLEYFIVQALSHHQDAWPFNTEHAGSSKMSALNLINLFSNRCEETRFLLAGDGGRRAAPVPDRLRGPRHRKRAPGPRDQGHAQAHLPRRDGHQPHAQRVLRSDGAGARRE